MNTIKHAHEQGWIHLISKCVSVSPAIQMWENQHPITSPMKFRSKAQNQPWA